MIAYENILVYVCVYIYTHFDLIYLFCYKNILYINIYTINTSAKSSQLNYLTKHYLIDDEARVQKTIILTFIWPSITLHSCFIVK